MYHFKRHQKIAAICSINSSCSEIKISKHTDPSFDFHFGRQLEFYQLFFVLQERFQKNGGAREVRASFFPLSPIQRLVKMFCFSLIPDHSKYSLDDQEPFKGQQDTCRAANTLGQRYQLLRPVQHPSHYIAPSTEVPRPQMKASESVKLHTALSCLSKRQGNCNI